MTQTQAQAAPAAIERRHTPGPLTTRVSKDGDVAVMEGHSVVAECFASIRHMNEDARPEALANAMLYAASPGLLEALQMARSMIATERQSFADCNVFPGLTEGDDFDSFVSIGGALFEQHDADVVADYDRALAQMDAAIAATGARP